MRANSRTLAFAAVALALVALAIAAWAIPRGPKARTPLGLFSSLPIYWAESASIDEMLDEGRPQHWARSTLERDRELVPLDTLDGVELARFDDLILAQPRPLAPAENVALDQWVRDGGRVLIFADPFLTEHSRFALGDKRRPQDVVLLSPILRRWGLELTFDEEQPEAERTVRLGNSTLAVQLAGAWQPVLSSATATCAIEADKIVADCRIGKGRALIVADAALLDADRSDGRAPLEGLLERVYR